MNRGRFTMGRVGSICDGKGVKIPWVGGQYTMGRGVDIPKIGNSIYHG